ncbi:hypothetical protein RO21_11310 [[Actinobacillus] muris]|uniref:Uncharacterized protein n=1 Tax=Muribacter muris TaxID=67855 RepID=A0A0J5P2N4_9PAST|nr:hypothetical protein [Muribacter muris]KMK50521.1 hypothetical protein RO21_11310 [[Actinobacillus] muris] [Muribacter muris]
MNIEKFNQEKAVFQQQEQTIIQIQSQFEQNKRILEALQNEQSEIIQRSKDKLANNQMLSVDEYVELKQTDTGLKARIEYYQALNQDLEYQLADSKQSLIKIQNHLKHIRAAIFKNKAQTLMQALFSENKKALSEIFMYLDGSDEFNPTSYDEITKEQKILRFMGEQFKGYIAKNAPMPDEYRLSSALLSDSDKLATPAQLHKQAIARSQQTTGLTGLIQQLTA